MRDYRAYIIGIDGHRFLKAAQFASDHPNDVAAVKAAEQLLDGHDIELWDCARLVASFDHASHAITIGDDQMSALRVVPDQSLVPTVEVESKERAQSAAAAA